MTKKITTKENIGMVIIMLMWPLKRRGNKMGWKKKKMMEKTTVCYKTNLN